MPSNYNVDDILDEIKRKKSRGGQMVSATRASRQEEPFEEAYDTPAEHWEEDDEASQMPPKAQRSRFAVWEDEEAPAKAHTREMEQPRRRPAYEEEPVRSRRTVEWEDEEDDYPPRARRSTREEAPRRRSVYDEEPVRSRCSVEWEDEEDDYPPRVRRSTREEAPRRRPAYEEEPVRSRRSVEWEDEEDDYPPRGRRSTREEAPRRRPAYEEEPIRIRRSVEWEDEEDDYPPRARRSTREETPSRRMARIDDLSILRSRIEEPEHSPRYDEEGAVSHPTGGTGILTDRADILRNFGRSHGRRDTAEGFTSAFRSVQANRKLTALEELEQEEAREPVDNTRYAAAFGRNVEPPTEEDYTATQMNIQLYSMDDEGHAPIEEQRSRRRPSEDGQDEDAPRKKRRSLFAKRDSTQEESIEEDVDDFNTPKDANHVYADIKSIKTGILVRLALTAVLTAALLYFSFALTNISLPLLAFMLPEVNMRAFIGTNLGLLLAAVLVCSPTIGGGIMSLLRMKANSDSPIAIAAIAAVGQGAALVAVPEMVTESSVHYYFAVVALGLLFNNLGKLFMILRIERNFQLLANGGYQRHAFNIIGDRNLARELTRNQDLDTPVVGYSHPAGFLTNFLHLSYTEDYGENISRITTPLFLLFAVIASGITQYLYGDIFISLTAFSAMTAICAPITTTIAGNLPLHRMNKALVGDGSMVAGYTALDRFDDINCLVIKDSELFGPSSITLHGIKAFDEKRIDEAMIDAASVVCKSECVLNGIFTQMIGGNERILKKADSIVYEDSMGVSAWVDGKRVLIGNRVLMENHNIEIPTKDYERKFMRDGREVLYLSNSGDLTAMFVLSYNADPDIADELAVLASRGIGISVYTTDSNITPQKISEVFDFPEDMVEIVPYKLHKQCDRLLEAKERARAEIVYNGSLASKVRTLSAIISAKTSIVLGTILQSVGMIVGYGLLCFFAFTNATESITFDLLIAYQCFWAFIVMLLPNLRRY